MTHLKLVLCAGAAALGVAWAGAAMADDQPTGGSTPSTSPGGSASTPAAPAANPMPFPSMSTTLSANPNPAVFDAGPLGKVMVDGVLSGFGFWQSHPAFDGVVAGRQNSSGYGDLTNATVILNKTDGLVQFYVQAGAYSLPALGTPYVKSDKVDPVAFGYFQQGFLKIAPNANFDIKAGALPTLIGDEYTFTFENWNIERGLLWNQENAVTKGVQVDYTKGPLTVSLSWNDGFYSNRFNSMSGLITYTFKNSDTLSFIGMGALGTVPTASYVAPTAQANSAIFNLIYSHSHGPWTISPYIQYTEIPNNRVTGASGSTIGGALLVDYKFNPMFNVALRGEYISSSGAANPLGYGVGSNAWSITVTPTFQKGIFFARAELSYVGLTSGTPFLMFGPAGLDTNQTRVLGEAGVIF